MEAFSDGVFAIAITLLVLNLRAPVSRGGFGHDLLAQWPAYAAYLASFGYIGVIWVNHHYLFTRIARVNGGLLWPNLGPADGHVGAAVPDRGRRLRLPVQRPRR